MARLKVCSVQKYALVSVALLAFLNNLFLFCRFLGTFTFSHFCFLHLSVGFALSFSDFSPVVRVKCPRDKRIEMFPLQNTPRHSTFDFPFFSLFFFFLATVARGKNVQKYPNRSVCVWEDAVSIFIAPTCKEEIIFG